MMIPFKFIITLFLLVTFTTSVDAQQTAALPDGVIMAVKNGDTNTLSASFNDQIEIILPTKTAVYSKKQAEMVLKDFVEKHPVTEFQLIHQVKKDKASFAIANYYASNGRYRFTFLTKLNGGKIYIHQIRIEKQ